MGHVQRSTGGDTRRAILAALLKPVPVTAPEVAEKVGISPAGVRRHIDILLERGLIEEVESSTPSGTRGRPAKHYRLTAHGRESFGSGYDELALAAFAEVEALGGKEAVKRLARKRAEQLLSGARNGDSDGIAATVERVAHAFAARGYVAEANNVGSGLQLCQHHCPVHAVAAAYPEICEAEHELISELVGAPIAPLAMIANGDGVCTTHISLVESSAQAGGTTIERSGDD